MAVSEYTYIGFIYKGKEYEMIIKNVIPMVLKAWTEGIHEFRYPLCCVLTYIFFDVVESSYKSVFGKVRKFRKFHMDNKDPTVACPYHHMKRMRMLKNG